MSDTVRIHGKPTLFLEGMTLLASKQADFVSLETASQTAEEATAAVRVRDKDDVIRVITATVSIADLSDRQRMSTVFVCHPGQFLAGKARREALAKAYPELFGDDE